MSTIAITALAGITAPAAAVAATDGYEVVEVTNQAVPAGQTISITARCSAGKKPLGGGMYTGYDKMLLVDSHPLGAPTDPHGWLGTVTNEGTEGSSAGVHVICASPSGLPGYEVIGATKQLVGAGQATSATASCSPGKRPLGGGVFTSSNEMRIVESFPLGAPTAPQGWLATVASEGAQSGVTHVYAICADLAGLPGYEVATATEPAVPPGRIAILTTNCSQGKKALGGGAFTTSNATRIINDIPAGPVRNPVGWYSWVANRGTQSAVVHVYAICAS